MAVRDADALITRARAALAQPTSYVLGVGGWTGSGPAPAQPGCVTDVATYYRTLTSQTSARALRYRAGFERSGIDIATLPSLACDCSGFITWALEIPRFPAPRLGGWLDTSAICNDAVRTRRLFQRIDHPERGALWVAPDHGQEQGHVGLITEVAGDAVAAVLHCQADNYALPLQPGKDRSAIRETGVEPFLALPGLMVVRWLHFSG